MRNTSPCVIPGPSQRRNLESMAKDGNDMESIGVMDSGLAQERDPE
jgi:hypothetical protein